MAPASYGILGFGDGREDPPRVFRQKKTIKAICHELRASRKLVRKVSRSEATELRTAATADRLVAGRTRGPDTEVSFMHARPEFNMNTSL
jgi:hypothetical protein